MSTCTALSVPLRPAPTDQLRRDPSQLIAELFQARQQANYWKALFQRAKQREAELQERLKKSDVQIKHLQHQLYGKKSEKRGRNEGTSPPDKKKRTRGQQPGNPAPKRRNHDHLPVVEHSVDLPDDQKQCPQCGSAYEAFPGTEDSETIEIEVRAHRRVIRRRRYRPTCHCPANAPIVTAPPPPKLIPKGRYGISVWTEVLLAKFLFFGPSQRLITDLGTHGIALPPGTLAGGLQRIAPMLAPLYKAIGAHCRSAKRWHADETGWKVFVIVEEKPDHKRTLWVYRSSEAIFFAIALTKGAKEAEGFFGPEAEGILNVDRASNYKALVAVKNGTLLLAFCWAHTRRDFIDAARGDPEQAAWAASWIERIGELFHTNKQRVAAWREDPGSEAFAEQDARLRALIETFRQERDDELRKIREEETRTRSVAAWRKVGQDQPERQTVSPVRKRILTSLVNHWAGLTVFVEHPEVPMDNTEAERRLRGPAMGRKNYWGSGAIWASALAERCFSLFATLQMAGLNIRTWLTAFLTACAEAGGHAPTWAARMLPWNLTQAECSTFRQAQQGCEISAEVRRCLDLFSEEAAEAPGVEVSPSAQPPPGVVVDVNPP